MFDPLMPFTVAQGLQAGLDGEQIRTRFTRVIEGVYVDVRARVTPRIKAHAALLVHPRGSVVSHDSVLRMIGAPVALDPNEHVTVAETKDRRQRRGVRPHAMALRSCDVGWLDGLPATVAERTFIDMASRLPLVELVVLGDWLVAAGHTTTQRLLHFCRDCPARYATRAREAAGYVRPGVASAQETRTRMLIVLAGLPEPEVGVELTDTDGTVLMQVDLLLRLPATAAEKVTDPRAPIGLAIEYDGREHESRARREKDVVRDDQYFAHRLQPLKVTSSGIHKEPTTTVRRIYDALRLLGWPQLRPPGEDWRRHFER